MAGIATLSVLLLVALACLGFAITYADRIISNSRGGHQPKPREGRAAAQYPRVAARRFSDIERVLDVLLFLLATAALTLVSYAVAAGFVLLAAFALFFWNELRLIFAEAAQ